MQIVHAIRSEYRDEQRVEVIPAEEPRQPPTKREYTVQVADYQVVVCHDGTCPGLDADGHLLEGADRSHHHDYRFLNDERPEAAVLGEVLEMEAREAASTGAVVLDVKSVQSAALADAVNDQPLDAAQKG